MTYYKQDAPDGALSAIITDVLQTGHS